MGCSTSKIAFQGRRIFNKHGQRFRFRTLGRSSHHRIIEDISMHTTTCLDGSTTTTVDCNSITTSIDIENNDGDDDDDGDECCFPIMDHHPSELSSFSFMAKSNVVYNNNNNNVICDESNYEKVVLPSLKEEEVVEECELRNDQRKIKNGDDYDHDHDEKEEVLVEANRVSHCLSFKVYVRALDGESNRETKLGGMRKNKDFTEDATACMKQLRQFPKEQSTITLQSIQRVMSNSVKKVRRGKSFSRIIPKPTPINSILGESIRCHSSKNRTSNSSIW